MDILGHLLFRNLPHPKMDKEKYRKSPEKNVAQNNLKQLKKQAQ